MHVRRLVFCAVITTLFSPVRAAYLYTFASGASSSSTGSYPDGTSNVGTDRAIAYSRTFSAYANASYGAVGADTYSNCVSALGLFCNSSAYAIAEFKDSLTILGFGGYIEAQVFFRSPSLDGGSRGDFTMGNQSASWFGYTRGTFPAPPQTIRFAFTANVPFTLFAHVEGRACQDGGYLCYSGSSDGEGYSSFRQFNVFDLNNAPVSNFNYVTESRNPYNIAGGTNASAPEAGTLLTAGLALLVMLANRPGSWAMRMKIHFNDLVNRTVKECRAS